MAAEPISSGSLILEYCGEVISLAECYARLSTYQEWGVHDFYMFQLSSHLVIDARLHGNAARFINHSCDANAYTQTWTVGAQQRVGIWAKKDIEVGEEVTYNYNAQTFNARGEHNAAIQHCKCGALNCSQFLGEKTSATQGKRRRAKDNGEEGKKEKKKRKREKKDRSAEKATKSAKRKGGRKREGGGQTRAGGVRSGQRKEEGRGNGGQEEEVRQAVGSCCEEGPAPSRPHGRVEEEVGEQQRGRHRRARGAASAEGEEATATRRGGRAERLRDRP